MTKMTIKLTDEEQAQVVAVCEQNNLTRKQLLMVAVDSLTAKKDAEVPSPGDSNVVQHPSAA